MPEAGGGARLSDLEARWRVDRSPRVFLQLADELRRTGALDRAVEVLREGLSHHPESLSGRVALGRAELEAGDATAAAATFERVLARDPAQIVASKLLIEAWIRIGNADRARERLDIYRILQERDVEIGGFERRIAAMERSERMSAVIELAGAAAPAAEARPVLTSGVPAEQGAPVSVPLFDLGASSQLPPLELDSVSGLRTWTLASGAPEGAGAARGAGNGEMPFGTIHEPAASNARILGFFRTQALFLMASETPPEPSIQTALIDLEALVAPAPPAPAAFEPARVEAYGASAPAAEAQGATASAPPAAETELAAGLAPGMTFEQFSTTGFAAEVERESLVEPLSEVLERAGIDAEAPRQVDSPAVAPGFAAGGVEEIVSAPYEPGAATMAEALEAATAVEPEAESGAEIAPPAASEAPSATLARLYLDQGHLAEAEAEFRRVLKSRPDDESAAAGLRELGNRRSSDETVAGWADPALGTPAPPRPHRVMGLTQRKVETLRGYLERLRRSRARANVS